MRGRSRRRDDRDPDRRAARRGAHLQRNAAPQVGDVALPEQRQAGRVAGRLPAGARAVRTALQRQARRPLGQRVVIRAAAEPGQEMEPAAGRGRGRDHGGAAVLDSDGHRRGGQPPGREPLPADGAGVDEPDRAGVRAVGLPAGAQRAALAGRAVPQDGPRCRAGGRRGRVPRGAAGAGHVPGGHRGGDRDGRHGGDADRTEPPDAAPAAAPDRLQQPGRRPLGRPDHRFPQPALQVTHDAPHLPGGRGRSPAPSTASARSRASAREDWLFTEPTLQPSVAAVCASDRSL